MKAERCIQKNTLVHIDQIVYKNNFILFFLSPFIATFFCCLNKQLNINNVFIGREKEYNNIFFSI